MRWRQKRQDELIRGFRLGVVRTEKRKRGKSGDGTGDKQSVRVPSTRLPNIVPESGLLVLSGVDLR